MGQKSFVKVLKIGQKSFVKVPKIGQKSFVKVLLKKYNTLKESVLMVKIEKCKN